MRGKSPANKKSQRHSKATKVENGKEITIGNGSGCSHLKLDSLFIKTEDGCITKCAECKRIVIKHCPCITEEAVGDTEVSGLLPCVQRRAQVFS